MGVQLNTSSFVRPFMPHPPPYKDGAGLEYAINLADKAQKLSLTLTISGWVLVIAGALLAIAGSVLGSTKGNASGFWDLMSTHQGLVCSAFAIASAGIGWTFLDRGSSATRAASVATSAIMIASGKSLSNHPEADWKAYEACVNSKAAWLEGRMNNDRLESIVNAFNQNGGKGPQPKAPKLDGTK